jgi:hypothetical protein
MRAYQRAAKRYPLRAILLSLLLLLPLAARADDLDAPWRVSLYGGIATRNDTTQLFLHGHFHPDGNQIGLSVDRDIVDLGSGFTLVGEGGVTRFVSKSDETSLELGIGARYDFQFLHVPIGVSGFTGPSWADDPPVIATGSFHGRPINFQSNAWLNYVGAEVAVGLAPNWNAVLRYYHRSGAFGLFQPNADEGSTLGAGIQYRF